MSVKERFLRYVAIDTQSQDNAGCYPSTEKQKNLLRLLVKELKEMGLKDAAMDEWGYVTATIEASAQAEKDAPVIGLISHVDTAPDMSGANVRPRELLYEGGDIPLNGDVTMKLADFPFLERFKGKHLIVTDGTTLLGGDDKAGVAEIMSLAEKLTSDASIVHPRIRIAFTPDEEVGCGTDHFDVAAFGADYAYTVDGGDVGELEYENFNAAGATVSFRGLSVHPGTAKNTMVNAQNLAMEFHGMLPAAERPEHTEGREGFYHLTSMIGTVSGAKLGYILRDHDAQKLQFKKDNLLHIACYLNCKYGPGTVEVEIKDSYRNMLEKIKPHFHLVETARKAITKAGLTPEEIPVRGGTDGAVLSWKGLPCPNLGTGGFNFHGVCECTTVERMDKATEILLNIVELYSK